MSGLWTILVGNALPAAALAVVAYCVSRTFRRPALTHMMWVLVLIKLVTPPLLPWSISVSPETAAVIGLTSAEQPAAFSPATVPGDRAPETATSSHQEQRLTSGFPVAEKASISTVGVGDVARFPAEAATKLSWLTWMMNWLQAQWWLLLETVWIMGTVLLITYVTGVLISLRRRFLAAEPIDPASRQHVHTLAATLGLRRAPEVCLLDGIVSPLVWGVGPFTKIIFPQTLWDELSGSSRDALLLHELAHYRRGDQWVRVLEIVVGCLYWWHPCVWWARRELAAAEEECCDAWVVRHAGHQPRNYAEAIITTLDYLAGEPVRSRVITTGVNSMPVLKRRLQHIMQKTVSPQLPQSVRWSLLAAATVMLPLQPLVQIVPGNTLAAAMSEERTFEDVVSSIQGDGLQLQAISGVDVQPLPLGGNQLPEPPRGFWSQPLASQSRSYIVSPDRQYTIELRNGGESVAVIDNETQSQHVLAEENISCLVFTPEGDRFVTGSAAGDVRVWDASTGTAATLLGPMGDDRVTSIDVSADGRWVVTGSDAGSVMIWELASGSPQATWTSDSSRINCIRVLDDERIAVSTGHFLEPGPGRVLILDSETLEPILERATERVVATIEPDEQSGTGLLLTDYSGTVWSWDGIGTELTYREVIPKTDVERAVFSSAYRITTRL